MGRRRARRMNFALPIKLWLLDADGTQRIETACTLDVSTTGLRVFSRALQHPRQEIVIGYLNRKARYRVVWVGETGTPSEGVVGLTCLEPDKALFGDLLPDSYYVDTHIRDYVAPSPAPPPRPSSAMAVNPQKLMATRYPCEGTADVRMGEKPLRTWMPVTELSLDGCYLSTQSLLDVNTAVELRVFVEGIEFQASAKVQSRDPGIGMEVRFDSIATEQAARLSQIMGKLAERAATLCTPGNTSANTPLRTPANQKIDATVLAKWFERNEVLTRSQYEELLQRPPETANPQAASG